MKTTLKNVAAVVVIIAILIWAVSALRTQSYSGANLTFPVTGGNVTLTNPSQAPVSAQLVGIGTRTFNVTSSTEGVSGSSTRQGTGNVVSQLFAFDLPPGVTVLSVLHGTTITFAATTPVILQAIADPNDASVGRLIFIVTAVVVLFCLYTIGRPYFNQWMTARSVAQTPVAVVAAAGSETGGQGREVRSYGDNRSR